MGKNMNGAFHGKISAYWSEENFHLIFKVNLNYWSTLQEKQSRVIIDSDEEIEGGFSCLIDVKETGTPCKKIFRIDLYCSLLFALVTWEVHIIAAYDIFRT
jgi:hypothetical protein